MSEFLTSEQAAERIGIHWVTLSRWRTAGKGPAWTRVGRMALYLPEDIDRWEREQQQTFPIKT